MHLHLACCGGLWDSALGTTTWTSGGTTHSWSCWEALLRRIPDGSVVCFKMMAFNILPGWHVYLICCGGLWDSARGTTTWTSVGTTHSWCCWEALLRRIPDGSIAVLKMMAFNTLPGWHVHLTRGGLWDSALGTTTWTSGGTTLSWSCW
jgi:hypothetical protein